jgi:thiol-disulfide isomerase/thioredoxin
MKIRRSLLFLSSALSLAAQTEISGTLVGANGKPIPEATVTLKTVWNTAVTSATPDRKGAFSLHSEGKGLFVLEAAGVGYTKRNAYLYLDKPQRVTIQFGLAHPPYAREYQKITASTEGKSPLDGATLQRQADGVYSATAAATESEVVYELSGLTTDGTHVAPPGAAAYRLKNGRYEAVVKPVNGVTEIRFDPRLLPSEQGTARVRIEPAGSQVGQIALILDRLTALIRLRDDAERLEYARRKRLGIPFDDEFPIVPADQGQIDAVLRRLNTERRPPVRQALWAAYLGMTLPGKQSKPELVEKALEELGPESPYWAHGTLADLGEAVYAVPHAETYGDYLTRAIDAEPDVSGKGSLLMSAMYALKQAKQPEMVATLLAKARKELPERYQRSLAMAFDPEQRVRPGQPVPEFAAPSFDDPKVLYTNTSLKGKVYLIDFWATWCGPCVGEMPSMQKAYEKFKNDGFEILSYSIDATREVVEKFRKERYPMPWLHAIDPDLKEWDSQMVKDFDVGGIPRAVLVDANGIIIAKDQDARSDKLEETLARALHK